MKLTDEDKRRLTEFLEKKWHELDIVRPYPDRPEEFYTICVTCRQEYDESHDNSTFTAPDDVYALMNKLVKEGMWDNFYWSLAPKHHKNIATCTNDHIGSGVDPESDIGSYGIDQLNRILHTALKGKLLRNRAVRTETEYIIWLFRLTDENGEPHFAGLVNEFLKGEGNGRD